MKIKILAPLFLILSAIPALAGVYPQGGLELTTGTNNLTLFTPWVALRMSLTYNASFILKYYHHSLSYDYEDEELLNKTRKASISNLTSVFYYQKGKTSAYVAGSYLSGSDSYKGLVFDAGIGRDVLKFLTVEGGVYLLLEDSVLWFPDEEKRDISLYSLKGGLKIRIYKKWITFNPNIYIYRNSEDVNAISYSLGFIVNPGSAIFITAYYYRYSERDKYKFSGDYFSLGLNFYY